jgi:iron complex outermembrane receptor protein
VRFFLFLCAGILASAPPVAEARQPEASTRTPSDTTRVFLLGEVEIVGTRESATMRLSEHLSPDLFRAAGGRDLSEALPRANGVALQRVGPRNEAGLRLRGFDLRHVPLYVDGIPVYVPYDGFVDLARFLTTGVSRITVSKGFSSLLYGPNALAGTVNAISRQPTRRLEGSLQAGWRSPGGREASLSLGTRQGRWFALGDIAYLDQEAFRLSDDFKPGPAEDGGHRSNAFRTDLRASAKIGFAPTDNAVYAIGYVFQDGEKGNPPYAGPRGDFRVRYWQWPEWDKESLYFLADQSLGESAHLRGRIFYDQFASTLFSYDDSTFSSQTKPFAFQQFNDDDSYGGSLTLSTTKLAGHSVGLAAHVKRDRHRERDANSDVGHYEDVTWSVGLEDEVAIGSRIRLVAGLMFSQRRTRAAERLDLEEVFPRTTNGQIDGHVAILHSLSDAGHVFATVGRRSRFPTIKDRYSYREGRALPNPSLVPEQAVTVEVGHEGNLFAAVTSRATLFYSRVDDVILAGETTDPESGRNLAQLQNAGRARHMGGEIALGLRGASWIAGEASYAYVHLENVSEPELVFTHTPSHVVRLSLDVFPMAGLSLRGWMNYESSRNSRIEGTDLTQLDGHAIIDVEAAYVLQFGVGLRAGVRNLLDTNYEIVAGYPEPGRTVFAGVTYTIRR